MLDILFLGSGNAFAAEGRAFSSFLLNGRYLFDCGPTVLQQLQKAGVPGRQIEAVFVSHYHADHFFGLPFLMLDGKYGGRTEDLTIIGPPGIEDRTRRLLELGYPTVSRDAGFRLRYLDVQDGRRDEAAGLAFTPVRVDHVEEFECFAFRVDVGG